MDSYNGAKNSIKKYEEIMRGDYFCEKCYRNGDSLFYTKAFKIIGFILK